MAELLAIIRGPATARQSCALNARSWATGSSRVLIPLTMCRPVRRHSSSSHGTGSRRMPALPHADAEGCARERRRPGGGEAQTEVLLHGRACMLRLGDGLKARAGRVRAATGWKTRPGLHRWLSDRAIRLA